jgi:hypothetical protein
VVEPMSSAFPPPTRGGLEPKVLEVGERDAAHEGMSVEPGPRSSLEGAETELLLELLMRLLAHSARLDGRGQRAQRRAWRLVAEVELALATAAPFADQPGFLARQVFAFAHGWAIGDPHPHGRETGREHALGALAPCDAAPGTIAQSRRPRRR